MQILGRAGPCPPMGPVRVPGFSGPKGRPFFLIYKRQPKEWHPKVTSSQLKLMKALRGLKELNWISGFLGQRISVLMEFVPPFSFV
jgi:hypothetical protein